MRDLVSKTKEICRVFEINPSKSKGQNFLVSSKVYEDIVESANIKNTDQILEVGPGLGFLTSLLVKKAKKVVAVELDENLASYLQTGFMALDSENIEIINQDILRFNPKNELSGDYKIVANLPYNITSVFLRTFLSNDYPPVSMTLMIQKEVAERIAEEPGDMSLLSVSVQHYSDVDISFLVKADNFWPQPEVDSAVINLNIKPRKFNKEEDKKFFRLVKAGFSSKRKMLKKNLAGGLQIDADLITSVLIHCGINEKARAEDLSLKNWYKLFGSLRETVL